MIDLTPAPAPDQPLLGDARPHAGGGWPSPVGVTEGPGGPGAGAELGRSRSSVDLRGRLARDVGRRRSAADGGAWSHLRGAAAVEARAGGRPAGPLERTILAVKDLVAVAGLPLGAGSRTRAGAPPEPADAGIVRVLRSAGAVVAGTVTLHEMAFGVSGVNDEVGFPANPHDRSRVPGGSSSGSAVAVADGTCDLAVGTDTGGSVRIPAALCGVVGFKPAGRYPLDGVLPLAPTLDQVGLLARSVADVAVAHGVVTGDAPPGGPALSRPAGGLRIGVDAAGLGAADAPVADAVEAVLRRLRDAGCELVDVDWPDRAGVLDVSTTIMFAEAASVHRRLLDGPAAALLGAPVAARFRTGMAIGEADYRAARRAADGLAVAVRRVLDTVDAVVGPTVPIVAPTVEDARRDEALPRRLVAETRLANVARVAALTLPAPAAGLPIGVQVTGVSDAGTLAAGGAIAALLADLHPPTG